MSNDLSSETGESTNPPHTILGRPLAFFCQAPPLWNSSQPPHSTQNINSAKLRIIMATWRTIEIQLGKRSRSGRSLPGFFALAVLTSLFDNCSRSLTPGLPGHLPGPPVHVKCANHAQNARTERSVLRRKPMPSILYNAIRCTPTPSFPQGAGSPSHSGTGGAWPKTRECGIRQPCIPVLAIPASPYPRTTCAAHNLKLRITFFPVFLYDTPHRARGESLAPGSSPRALLRAAYP